MRIEPGDITVRISTLATQIDPESRFETQRGLD